MEIVLQTLCSKLLCSPLNYIPTATTIIPATKSHTSIVATVTSLVLHSSQLPVNLLGQNSDYISFLYQIIHRSPLHKIHVLNPSSPYVTGISLPASPTQLAAPVCPPLPLVQSHSSFCCSTLFLLLFAVLSTQDTLLQSLYTQFHYPAVHSIIISLEKTSHTP